MQRLTHLIQGPTSGLWRSDPKAGKGWVNRRTLLKPLSATNPAHRDSISIRRVPGWAGASGAAAKSRRRPQLERSEGAGSMRQSLGRSKSPGSTLQATALRPPATPEQLVQARRPRPVWPIWFLGSGLALFAVRSMAAQLHPATDAQAQVIDLIRSGW